MLMTLRKGAATCMATNLTRIITRCGTTTTITTIITTPTVGPGESTKNDELNI